MAQCQTVSADAARRHLQHLEKTGIGYRQAAALSGLAPRGILRIRNGDMDTIRRLTEQRILAIRAQFAPGARVRPQSTWRKLSALRAEGFSLAELGRRLGLPHAFRPRRRDWIRAKTAAEIRALYRAHIDEPDATP